MGFILLMIEKSGYQLSLVVTFPLFTRFVLYYILGGYCSRISEASTLYVLPPYEVGYLEDLRLAIFPGFLATDANLQVPW